MKLEDFTKTEIIAAIRLARSCNSQFEPGLLRVLKKQNRQSRKKWETATEELKKANRAFAKAQEERKNMKKVKRDVVIWCESVYTNGFKCHCGKQLANKETGEPMGDVLLECRHGRKMFLICPKCFLDVAYIKKTRVPENVEGLQGDIKKFI